MEILYLLPTATPKFSSVESAQKYAKYKHVVSEHHETREDMMCAISEYFTTSPIRLYIYNSCAVVHEAKFSMSATLVAQRGHAGL